MKIHEYQGKEILRKYNVTVPKGAVAFTGEEAVKIAKEELGGDTWVVKDKYTQVVEGKVGE